MDVQVNVDRFRRLLLEGEGTALDFKSTQYRFEGAPAQNLTAVDDEGSCPL